MTDASRFVAEAFLIVLGRDVNPIELRDTLRGFKPGDYDYAAVDLYGNPHQTPHMVVRFDDTVFTTAFVFLRKDAMLGSSG